MNETRRNKYLEALEDVAALVREEVDPDPVEQLKDVLNRMGADSYVPYEVRILVPFIEGWSAEEFLQELWETNFHCGNLYWKFELKEAN